MLVTRGNPLALNYVQWLTLARRVAKHSARRTRSSARVMLDDVEANQLFLNRGWSTIVE
jgi:hypothetical protein